MSADRPVTLAVIIGAHGVTGEVRLKVFTEDLARYKVLNATVAGVALTLKSARPGSNGTIARFAEVTDRNAAEALRGTELTVPRSALPPLEPGEYYHSDLIGLAAVSTTGEALGRVVLIEDFGAGDVIEIERENGQRFMVPMNADAVPEWDGERVVVDGAFVI
ncbi:ribosome maturation factor RimM [Sphingomonas panacis]|uniref:Ribosome maturation factor RimM n=1 Tax=Sphingomonas panacis TaxID=1560345 RepID=A0A1B3ZDI2_9SPHN|nr:ribosome maturation factor RimM [Sphingomonas panacis]AOH85467.1 ribosome maturation factor RimM [Sphingomonas panacis]